MSDHQPASPVNLHQVLLEIDEEVRAKRASGELPADLERELDLLFARFAPPGAVEGDFPALMKRAEQQAFIDLLAPNESVRPGVPQVKRVVQKTVRWYIRYVIEQLSGFAHTITKAVGILGQRVEQLEQATTSSDEVDAVLRRLADLALPWAPHIAADFAGTKGRVLHARSGDGSIVAGLKSAGLDAYGVDATPDFVAAGTAAGLDLRPDDEREHMRLLPPGALGGLLLTGCVDTLPRGGQVELVDLAAVALDKGASFAMVTTNPLVWDRLAGVPTELSPGQPMRAETWTHLLVDRGFSDVEVQSMPTNGLVHLPGTGEEVLTMNNNIDKLNSVLYPPVSFLITARR